jgi:hypothetical protein
MKIISLIFREFLGVDPGLRTNTENTEKFKTFVNKMIINRLDTYLLLSFRCKLSLCLTN